MLIFKKTVILQKKVCTTLHNEFLNILNEANKDYVEYVKDQEVSIPEKIFQKKWKESYFATSFEVVRHEWSLKIIISITDPVILKKSGFMDRDKNTKNLALQKLQRQKSLQEYTALPLID